MTIQAPEGLILQPRELTHGAPRRLIDEIYLRRELLDQIQDPTQWKVEGETFIACAKDVMIAGINQIYQQDGQSPGQTKDEKANDWVKGMRVGLKYKGGDDAESIKDHFKREYLSGETIPAFYVGLHTRRQLHGTALGIQPDALPTYMPQESPAVAAFTALRDDLDVFKKGGVNDVYPEFIEDRLAERGILIPDAWNHIYERVCDGVKVNVDYLLDMAGEQTGEKFDNSRLPLTDKLLDFCQQKGIIPAKYPPPRGSEDEIAKVYSHLDALSHLFAHGARSDMKLVLNSRDRFPVDFSNLDIRQIMADARSGKDKMILLAGEAEQAETKEGEVGFLIGTGLRSLLTPYKEGMYSARNIFSRMERVVDNKEISDQLLETVIKTLADSGDLYAGHPLVAAIGEKRINGIDDVLAQLPARR